MNTITIAEMLKELRALLKQDPELGKYKVYVGSDPEGNGYGSLQANYSLQFGDEDKVLTIMPYEQGQDEDIAPIQYARIMKEIDEQFKKEVGDGELK